MTRTMLTAILLMSAQLPCAAQDAASETSISLAAFSDGIKHWQDRHGKDYARTEHCCCPGAPRLALELIRPVAMDSTYTRIV